MKAVMISEQPKAVVLIINGEKTVIIFKTAPKLETPFKCYIYMTQGKLRELGDYSQRIYENRMKVIGEFICDEIKTFKGEFWDNETYERIQKKYKPMDFDEYGEYEYETIAEEGEDNWLCQQSCLKWEDLRKYIGQGIHEFYCWHISDLKIYDEPKEISEFKNLKGEPITRAFQSWGYINA